MFGHVLNELYGVKFGKSFSLLAYIGFKCAKLKKNIRKISNKLESQFMKTVHVDHGVI